MFHVSDEDMHLLIEKELSGANQVSPPFHSLHEGYAVLLEEVCEAERDMDSLQQKLDCMWAFIMDNASLLSIQVNSKKILDIACHLSKEAIQVAAMAQKCLDFCASQATKEEGS